MPDLGWVSHVLYVISPILTVLAFVFQILIRDCKFSRVHLCVFRLPHIRREISSLTLGSPRRNIKGGQYPFSFS